MSKSTVIAVTGGIGTGKSTVTNLIREMGYKVLSSDDNAKILMKNNDKIKQKLISEFGNEVYSEDGQINNVFLSGKVFGTSTENEKALLRLNSIVHPEVIQMLIEEVEKLEESGEEYIFVESALTFEAGLEEGFDFIIVVDCEEELAVKRVVERSGLSKEQVQHRMSQQISNQRKREMADFVIENNKGFDELKSSTEFIINLIKMSGGIEIG